VEALRLIIISVPPKEVYLSLEKSILKLSKLSGSVTASLYPPHITLRTGLIVPLRNLVSFLSEFSILLAGIKSFRVRTDKIIKEKMVFDNKESFFIGYEIILDDFLYDLNKNLLSYTKFRKSDRTEFHPHLSLAYNDLTVGYHTVYVVVDDGTTQLTSDKQIIHVVPSSEPAKTYELIDDFNVANRGSLAQSNAEFDWNSQNYPYTVSSYANGAVFIEDGKAVIIGLTSYTGSDFRGDGRLSNNIDYHDDDMLVFNISAKGTEVTINGLGSLEFYQGGSVRFDGGRGNAWYDNPTYPYTLSTYGNTQTFYKLGIFADYDSGYVAYYLDDNLMFDDIVYIRI